jgi:hypothetical protein
MTQNFMPKLAAGFAAFALLASAAAPTAAFADNGNHRGWYKQHRNDRGYDVDGERYYRTSDGRIYDDYGNQYQGYRKCDKGTEGLIIGGLAGGALGYTVAKGDRALGAILGLGVGALAGRALDKADSPCRRR